MRAIILAAGEGRRMRPLTADRPKALLPVGHTTVVGRLLEQLEGHGVNDVTIVVGFEKNRVIKELEKYQSPTLKIHFVHNDRYLEDVNILSLALALEKDDSPFYLFEGDILFDEESIARIFDPQWSSRSVWFTLGLFNPSQLGGILKSDAERKIQDIQIVPEYNPSLAGYKKLLGVMKVGPDESKFFAKQLSQDAAKNVKQYYLYSWIRNMSQLPAWEVDLEGCLTATFNTAEDFNKAVKYFEGKRDTDGTLVQLVDVSKLKHIEAHSPERVQWLKNKIQRERMWTQPLKIDRDNFLVLDGQHRFEVARELGLSKVPCQLFNYRDIEIWSLRDDCEVTHDLVIQRSLKGDIYPYKTVKHKFIDPVQICSVPLSDLMKGTPS